MTDQVATPAVDTATPTAAPVAQPTPAAQPAPTPEVVYQQVPSYNTESVIETAVNVFASTAGIEASRFEAALTNALQYGDANLIDYANLTAGLKPDQAAQAKALALSAFNDTKGRQDAAHAHAVQVVNQVAGGADAWREASDAFNTSAPAHLKAVVSQLLENGNVEHAAKFVLDTVRGTGMVNHGTPPLQGGTGAVQQGISQETFRAELAKLEKSAGGRSYENGALGEQLAQLRAARALGAKQGL